MVFALVGNPNCGKSTLFNALCRESARVGNFPGVTTEALKGRIENSRHTLIDLPGSYSLTPFTEEESVTSAYLKSTPPDAILNVIDPSTLRRSLFLTLELFSLGIPMLLVLNLEKGKKAEFDPKALAGALNLEVIEASPTEEEGVLLLQRRLEKRLPPSHPAMQGFGSEEERITSLYQRLDRICDTLAKKERNEAKPETLDRLFFKSRFSYLFSTLTLLLVFYLAFGLLGPFLTKLSLSLINGVCHAVATKLTSLSVAPALTDFITDGVIGGVGTALALLPSLSLLFFLMAFLEESGYMARLACLFDPLFSRIGLSGRSVFPLLLGFGCTTSAAWIAKGAGKERERKRTVLLLPYITCSAKLPIYLLFSSVFFSGIAFFSLFLLYLLSIGVTLGMAALLCLGDKGEKRTPFFMELPDYRIPSASSLLKKTGKEAKAFLEKAFTVLFLASLFSWFLISMTPSLLYTNTPKESLLALISTALLPIFRFLGIRDWEPIGALLPGLLAKEAIVTTFAVLAPSGLSLESYLPRFFTPASATAYLLFILFYPPCVAALCAIGRQFPKKRAALLIGAFHLVFAFLLSSVAYAILA